MLKECYILSKHGKLGDIEVMKNLPVYERRFFLNELEEEAKRIKDQQEKHNSQQKNNNNKKPRR